MSWEPSARTRDLLARMGSFFDRHITPNEHRWHAELAERRNAGNAWQPSALVDELDARATATTANIVSTSLAT